MNYDSIVRTSYVVFRTPKRKADGAPTIEEHITGGTTLRHGEQFLGPLGEPLIPGCGLTLGTMPIAAGVVGDEAMRALGAFLDVAAQSGGATGADVTESFPLLR
jgi:hypothetical protein